MAEHDNGTDLAARRWQEYVTELRRGTAPPFAEQWQRYREIFADRAAELGPPPAWQPSQEVVERSNLGSLMEQEDIEDYAALHRWSTDDRAGYWNAAIDRLGIVFSTPPVATLESSAGPTRPRWLPDAELDIVDSCFTADPETVAVIEGGERSTETTNTTYGELEALVNRFANGLAEHGFAPGDGIALFMPMTLDCVVAYLGTVRAGCYVVSIADSFSAAELDKRLVIAGARGLVTVESYQRAGRSIDLYSRATEVDAPRTIVIPGPGDDQTPLREQDLHWQQLLSESTTAPAIHRPPEALTNVLFSSGTTGTPKAIPWTQLTPLKCAADGHFHQDIHADDVVAWPTNIGWMMGPWLIYASLMNNAAVALYEGVPSTAGFANFVENAGVSVLGVVPSLVRAWRESDACDGADWSGVRVLSSTGEPSNAEDYLWLMSRTGYRAPVIEYCGGTEIGGGHITGTVAQPASPATFTTPALGIDLVVLDEDGRQVGESGTGEIFLVPPSIGLSEKLLNADHEAVYHADCPPGPAGEVLRRHGDQMLRLHRGFYRAQGRADDTMNLGGIKVSSKELESVLDEHPEVYESAAVAVQPTGEGAEKLVVFVVLRSATDHQRLTTELRSLIKQKLNPLFKIHDVVIADKLPRTASNKLMRRSLRAMWCETEGSA